jgi:VanZ family protein
MLSHKSARILLALAAIVFLGVIFVFGKMPSNTAFWREFENGGHAPLFGFAALIVLGIIRTLGIRKLASLWLQYALSFSLASAMGIGSEVWQYFNHRDAEIRDILTDMAGAFAFLAIWWTVDHAVAAMRRLSPGVKWTLRSVAAGLIVIVYIPAIFWLSVVVHRNMIFPRLAAFDSKLERKLFVVRDAELETAAPPSGWTSIHKEVGKVTFFPATYPSLLFTYMYPRLEEYKSLKFEVYSDNDTTLDLAFRIYDAGSSGCYPDRYNTVFKIQRGLTQIDLPIDTLKLTESGRIMNLDHTAGMILFLIEPKKPTTLYFDDFRLE